MKTIRRTRLGVSATLGALLFLGAATGQSDIGEHAVPASGFAQPIAYVLDVPFRGHCHWCEECGDDPVRHKATSVGEEQYMLPEVTAHEELHECSGPYSQGECLEYHIWAYPWDCEHSLPGAADGQPTTTNELLNVLADASVSELRTLLTRYAGAITFNPQRDAIQAFACNGAIVAHLPLSAEAAAALRVTQLHE
jgi:hypothetical protein